MALSRPRHNTLLPRLQPLRNGLSALVSLGSIPWLVLGAGLLATGLQLGETRRGLELERRRFERSVAEDVAAALQAKLTATTGILSATVGLFQASELVSRPEFHRFFRSLDLSAEVLRGIQGVGYAERVPAGTVAAFESRIAAEGLPGFRLRPAPAARPGQLIAAIVYLEPLDWRNRRALGFDMASEASRRLAMENAALSGRPTLSGPVRLMQEAGADVQTGALLYLPVFRNGIDPEPDRSHPEDLPMGWAYAALRMGDLARAALAGVGNPGLPDSNLWLYDGSSPQSGRLLFHRQGLDGGREGAPVAAPSQWLPFSAVDRQWLVGVRLAHDAPILRDQRQDLWLWSLMGVLASLLAALVSRLLVRSHLATADALRAAEQAARERALAETVFETSPIGMLVTDPDGIVLTTNLAFSQISGWSRVEARGHKANLLRSGRHDDNFYAALWQAILQQGHWHGELWNRHRNGRIRRHELSITAVRDGEGRITHFVGMLQDVSERYSQSQRVHHRASHDFLTGLPNRARMLEELERCLGLARRGGARPAMMFLDLDGFKPVNDSYGHSVGDQVLRQVAQRLRRAARVSDLLGREGGDEFVLLIPEAGDRDDLQQQAERLRAVVAGPYEGLPPEVRVAVSIGIARWPEDGDSPMSLLQAADSAMYQAKRAEGSHIHFAGPPVPESGPESIDAPAG